jgi:hypothetical protein
LVIEIGQIIHDFAIIMIVAAVMSLLSYKLKQPMVIGYIIAGMIIGHFAFNFIFNGPSCQGSRRSVEGTAAAGLAHGRNGDMHNEFR